MIEELSKIRIKFDIEDFGSADGELIRFSAPRTVENILNVIPIDGIVSKSNASIYFPTRLKLGREKAKSDINKGEITYWPLGSAICVFYGSSKPYSPMNLIGHITDNLEIFENIEIGKRIKMAMKG
jgi:hypothetical protein